MVSCFVGECVDKECDISTANELLPSSHERRDKKCYLSTKLCCWLARGVVTRCGSSIYHEKAHQYCMTCVIIYTSRTCGGRHRCSGRLSRGLTRYTDQQ